MISPAAPGIWAHVTWRLTKRARMSDPNTAAYAPCIFQEKPNLTFFFPHCKGNFVPLPVWPVKPSTLARAPTLPDSAGPFWHIHAVMLGCTLAGMAAFRYTWISIVSSTLGMCSSSIFLLYIPPHIHHSLSSLFVFRASVPTTSRQPLHPPNPFSAFSCFTEPR